MLILENYNGCEFSANANDVTKLLLKWHLFLGQKSQDSNLVIFYDETEQHKTEPWLLKQFLEKWEWECLMTEAIIVVDTHTHARTHNMWLLNMKSRRAVKIK